MTMNIVTSGVWRHRVT